MQQPSRNTQCLYSIVNINNIAHFAVKPSLRGLPNPPGFTNTLNTPSFPLDSISAVSICYALLEVPRPDLLFPKRHPSHLTLASRPLSRHQIVEFPAKTLSTFPSLSWTLFSAQNRPAIHMHTRQRASPFCCHPHPTFAVQYLLESAVAAQLPFLVGIFSSTQWLQLP